MTSVALSLIPLDSDHTTLVSAPYSVLSLACFPLWLMISFLKPFSSFLVPPLYLQGFMTLICLHVYLSFLDSKLSKGRDSGSFSLSPPSTGLNKCMLTKQMGNPCSKRGLFVWAARCLENVFSSPKQCLFLLREPPTNFLSRVWGPLVTNQLKIFLLFGSCSSKFL